MLASLAPTIGASYGGSILVVEDSDEDFDTLVEAVRSLGWPQTIHRALCGGDCIALLQGDRGADQAAPSWLPTLIFMDLNSHGVDGREALILIKTDPALKEIPLVILTTSANPKDQSFCAQAGANAYHVKPVRHDHYLQLLRSVLLHWFDSDKLQHLTATAH